MAATRAKGKWPLALILLASAGIDIAVTAEAAQHGGDWAVVALVSGAMIPAVLVDRVVFRPRWRNRRYADLAADRPDIEALVATSQTPEVQVVHHHHYERQPPWAPLSVGLGLGAAVMWICTLEGQVLRDRRGKGSQVRPPPRVPDRGPPRQMPVTLPAYLYA
jgi:hypothetical protein